MTNKASIYDGVPYIYAEQLRGKRATLTIKCVEGGAEFYNNGKTSVGFNVHFEETPRFLGIVGITVRRQMFAATGTEDPAEMAGKKIVLYPIDSAKSPTGKAIRIAKA